MKLKKFLSVILTAITAACIAVGFSGCKDLGDNKENCPPYPPMQKQQYFDSFEDLKSFYETDFKKTNNEQFYLLTPEYEVYYKFCPTQSCYEIYGENYDTDSYFEEPKILEHITAYFDELGSDSFDPTMDGSYPFSFFLDIEFQPLSSSYQKRNNFTFEFEEYPTPYICDMYKFKIYDGATPIAEGIFDKHSEISNEWVENYLIRNLI